MPEPQSSILNPAEGSLVLQCATFLFEGVDLFYTANFFPIAIDQFEVQVFEHDAFNNHHAGRLIHRLGTSVCSYVTARAAVEEALLEQPPTPDPQPGPEAPAPEAPRG